MNPIFEYCRFQTAPRAHQDSPITSRDFYAARAEASGGKLFGCWKSLVGLGLARDEGIALTSWPDIESARAAPAPANAERSFTEATVRPLSDAAPTYSGVYVFRWFDVAATEWEAFRDISNAAWPNMENVFDVNICGFWRDIDTPAPASRTLLLTRYADLSVWEASRWWKQEPAAGADAFATRLRARNDMIEATVAYPTLLIE